MMIFKNLQIIFQSVKTVSKNPVKTKFLYFQTNIKTLKRYRDSTRFLHFPNASSMCPFIPTCRRFPKRFQRNKRNREEYTKRKAL